MLFAFQTKGIYDKIFYSQIGVKQKKPVKSQTS